MLLPPYILPIHLITGEEITSRVVLSPRSWILGIPVEVLRTRRCLGTFGWTWRVLEFTSTLPVLRSRIHFLPQIPIFGRAPTKALLLALRPSSSSSTLQFIPDQQHPNFYTTNPSGLIAVYLLRTSIAKVPVPTNHNSVRLQVLDL